MSIAEIGMSGPFGIGYGRIGYSSRWGILGEKEPDWPYYQVFAENSADGVFLSPQLMLSLSKGSRHPKHDAAKSDIFALGIMIVEILFGSKLDEIFDY